MPTNGMAVVRFELQHPLPDGFERQETECSKDEVLFWIRHWRSVLYNEHGRATRVRTEGKNTYIIQQAQYHEISTEPTKLMLVVKEDTKDEDLQRALQQLLNLSWVESAVIIKGEDL